MKFSKLALFLLPALMASSAFATQISCPAAKDVQSVGVTIAKPNGDNYAVGIYDNFGTPQFWGFVVSNVAAVSSADALSKANAALASLSLTRGPVSLQNEIAICNYIIGGGYYATAITVQ